MCLPLLCLAAAHRGGPHITEGHSVERMYLRQRCFDGSLTGSVNKTIVKPCVAAAANTYTWDFPNVKFRVRALYTIAKKAIRFRHPDYNPDRAQKLISSSMSRNLSTRNISSKSMHALLSNLANRQTDKQTRANAFTSFVRGNKITYYVTNRRTSIFDCEVILAGTTTARRVIVASVPGTGNSPAPHLQDAATWRI